jgi:hypothetical protein
MPRFEGLEREDHDDGEAGVDGDPNSESQVPELRNLVLLQLPSIRSIELLRSAGVWSSNTRPPAASASRSARGV